MSVSGEGSRPSFREQKKARVRAEIQRAALRLFQEQGYEATTATQIAEAAGISRVTFFRYFPAKADAVLYEVLDDTVVDAFRAQPPGDPPIRAMRAALRATFLDATQTEKARNQDRDLLLRTIPELRSALQARLADKLDLLCTLVAERLHRPASDIQVLALAGAMIGVGQAAWLGAETGPADGLMDRYYRLFDAGLAHLEAGPDHWGVEAAGGFGGSPRAADARATRS